MNYYEYVMYVRNIFNLNISFIEIEGVFFILFFLNIILL